MELIKFMKEKIKEGKRTMNVDDEELKSLEKLKTEGYLREFRCIDSKNGKHNVVFIATEKFKNL